MKLNVKGFTFEIDKEKWKQKSFKDKLEFWKEYIEVQFQYKIEHIKDYWIGYVDISTQDIGVSDDEGNHVSKLYEVSITVGRFGKGQFFSHIDYDMCKNIVDKFENSTKKNTNLLIDFGCGMSQNYMFSNKQKELLIEKLKPLLDMDWYINDDYEDDCF